MTILQETSPHYVRCIKPNEAKAALSYAPRQVLDQRKFSQVQPSPKAPNCSRVTPQDMMRAG